MGDRILTGEQRQMVVDHLPIADAIARSFPSAGDADEVKSKAREALIVLALRFDPSKGSFTAYVRTYLRRGIVDMIRTDIGRHGQRKLPPIRLEFGLPGEAGEDLSYADLVADVSAGPEELVVAELTTVNLTADVWRYVETLPPRSRRLLIDLYRVGRRQLDIANELGVTPSRISQLHARALEELRDAIESRRPVPACKGCSAGMPPPCGRGRPREWCTDCRPPRAVAAA